MCFNIKQKQKQKIYDYIEIYGYIDISLLVYQSLVHESINKFTSSIQYTVFYVKLLYSISI